MAKLPRVYQRIFAANAEPADLGVVGSKHNGNPTTAASAGVGKNIANLMALSNFLTGLRACVDQNRAPALQDHNSLFYILSQQIAYLMQAGIAEWESTTEYYAGSSVILYNGVLYLAKADNIGIEPGVNADWTTYWNSFNLDFDTTPILGSSKAVTSNGIYEAINLRLPVGTILPFAGENIPAGFLLCDGAEISRTTYSNLFSVIGTLYGDGDGSASFNLPNIKLLTGLGTTAPVFATTQLNDLNRADYSTILFKTKNNTNPSVECCLSFNRTSNGELHNIWGYGAGATANYGQVDAAPANLHAILSNTTPTTTRNTIIKY